MRYYIRFAVLVGIVGVVALGCQSSKIRHPYPQDPLLLYKRPIEAGAEAAAPRTVAQAEPSPPAVPVATASAEFPEVPSPVPEFRTAERSPGPAPTQSATITTKTPVVATPTVRSKEITTIVTTPAIRRQVPETHGHAADYGWLQGVLEKHYTGRWELRYCNPSVEDKWGGKVSIVDDPRLAHFKEGDLILVEGEVIPEEGPRDAWRHFPRYRAREIWLAQGR